MDLLCLNQRYIAAFILLLGTASALPLQPDTPLSDIAVCVFRISGTYGSISRWLYYTSLLTGTLTRENEWLAVGIMATAMVYSSAASVHAWVILFDSDTPLNPAIIDLDIIPITTMVVSTTLLFCAITEYCTTFRRSKKKAIMRLWHLWLWIGSMVCCAATWNLKGGPKGGRSSEMVCRDAIGTMLKSATELEMRKFTFSCTYDCLASAGTKIREAEETRVFQQADIYTGPLTALPGFALAAVLLTYIMSTVQTVHGAPLHEVYQDPDPDRWRSDRSHVEVAWTRMVEKYSLLGWLTHHGARIKQQFQCLAEGCLAVQIAVDGAKQIGGTLRELDAKAYIPLGRIDFWARLWAIIMLAPGAIVITLGETVILRRDSMLKSESYKAVGQWSAVVCVLLVVGVSAIDRYILSRQDLQVPSALIVYHDMFSSGVPVRRPPYTKVVLKRHERPDGPIFRLEVTETVVEDGHVRRQHII